MNSILFDIGGTKTRVAFSEQGKNFETPKVFETPQTYEAGMQALVEAIQEVSGKRLIKKVCGGLPGTIDNGSGLLLRSPNLAGWIEKPIKKDLQEKIQGEIFLENDAALAGLGEATSGAGRGFEIVAYITISTGVGGARIVNGKIDEKSIGFEPGAQILDIEENKTLEEMLSGRALFEKTGKNPKEIKDPEVWDGLAKILAVGMRNVVAVWSPDCLILGGSMITGDPSIPVEKTCLYFEQILSDLPHPPSIKSAELKDFGGLWGALAYLNTERN